MVWHCEYKIRPKIIFRQAKSSVIMWDKCWYNSWLCKFLEGHRPLLQTMYAWCANNSGNLQNSQSNHTYQNGAQWNNWIWGTMKRLIWLRGTVKQGQSKKTGGNLGHSETFKLISILVRRKLLYIFHLILVAECCPWMKANLQKVAFLYIFGDCFRLPHLLFQCTPWVGHSETIYHLHFFRL